MGVLAHTHTCTHTHTGGFPLKRLVQGDEGSGGEVCECIECWRAHELRVGVDVLSPGELVLMLGSESNNGEGEADGKVAEGLGSEGLSLGAGGGDSNGTELLASAVEFVSQPKANSASDVSEQWLKVVTRLKTGWVKQQTASQHLVSGPSC